MARPRFKKHINSLPKIDYYKPQGIKLSTIDEIIITLDEFETLKLKDYYGNSEIKASELMKISQPTFNRLYNQSKKKLIKALVEGLAIKIKGGNYKMPNRDGTGPNRNGQIRNSSQPQQGNRFRNNNGIELGRGRNRNYNDDNEQYCKCPQCDYKIKHTRANPCYTIKCPNCNVNLIRD